MLTKEENDLVTQTGPGTPGGAFMRRYWHAVATQRRTAARRPRRCRGGS